MTWQHFDVTRMGATIGAILHGIKGPDVGGETLFTDMYAAYDGLPDDVKEKIESLDVEHTFMHTFGSFLTEEQKAGMLQAYPPPTHPIVCTHDVTGRRHLYVNRGFASHVVGRGSEESREPIDLLCRQADYPEYQCRFH